MVSVNLMLRRAAAALVCGLACMAAGATDRALLVGVGRYPALPRKLWLDGPTHDVALMRQALLSKGFEAGQIRILSDAPRRADILGGMASLLADTRPGDRVVFHFSGHGSQQPQPPGARYPEADGLDEVLLPSDVGPWAGPGHVAAISNAILDDEIGDWIDALVDRGALVWAFFDTCHAAGMARGESEPVTRAVAPAELGLVLEAKPRQERVQAVPRLDGRVLIFAGRSHERVSEEWLPRGGGFARTQRHGVFTWHLAALLKEKGLADARLLMEALRSRYAEEGRTQPVPVLAGGAVAGRR